MMSDRRILGQSETALAGYLSEQYAFSLSEFGGPKYLSCCQGWIIERSIPGTSYLDGMGCYPRFCCRRWSAIEKDLAHLRNKLVTLTLVTDPFGDWTASQLRQAFPDQCVHFKDHFVVDCSLPMAARISKHHRYYARRALRHTVVEVCDRPEQMLSEWSELYGFVIRKYSLKGIQAFSSKAFVMQLQVPGLLVFRARYKGETVAAQLWFLQDRIAYNHLVACSDVGYQQFAAYALYWESLSYLANRVDWIDLGSSAGLSSRDTDGLSRFKRGWSDEIRPIYLCGRIFDRVAYDLLATPTRGTEIAYFPAYRYGEYS